MWCRKIRNALPPPRCGVDHNLPGFVQQVVDPLPVTTVLRTSCRTVFQRAHTNSASHLGLFRFRGGRGGNGCKKLGIALAIWNSHRPNCPSAFTCDPLGQRSPTRTASGCYTRAMHWIRTGRATRIVAVFFLLWTGVDLVNPSLCASDQQTNSRSARVESAVVTNTGSSQTAPNGGSEDCFCCCHHLVSTTTWALMPQMALSQRLVVPPVEQVRVFRTRLDHPPQLI